jgi:hypothetical protein
MAKTITANASKWADLQRKARETADADQTERIRLQVKYSAVQYASKTELRRLDVLRRAEDRARDRLYAYLKEISPRDWSQGVPITWVVRRLTFEDAVTAGQLAQIPDPAWGCSVEDSRRFAQPVRHHGQAS